MARFSKEFLLYLSDSFARQSVLGFAIELVGGVEILLDPLLASHSQMA